MDDDNPNLGENRPANRGNAGKGRPKGSQNKFTTAIKDAVLAALETAGDAVGANYNLAGGPGYMHHLALQQPVAFSTLLGKVLPTQVEGTGEDGKIVISWSNE